AARSLRHDGERLALRAGRPHTLSGAFRAQLLPAGFRPAEEGGVSAKRKFRLGIYVFKDVEIVDFAAPHGVFSVARRYDPELEAFLIADAMRPVQAQAGFTVQPNYSFNDQPDMDAFLIPGGFGTRQELHNRRLHAFIRALPQECLLTSVCTGSWI